VSSPSIILYSGVLGDEQIVRPGQDDKSMDGNWLRLEPAHPAPEEQAKALLAQLSWAAILFLVMFLLLPSVFDGWVFPPPWRWPGWGKIVGWLGVCLCGWICISCAITLGKRRFNNWGIGLGPYDVWLMQGSPPHQPLKLRIRQQTRRPVSIERLDVTLIYVETIVQVDFDPGAPHYHPALVRDLELWSETKTAFESRFFPADGTIEISTEFAIPEVAELHRRRDAEESKKPGGGNVETTRHFQWRVRIETYLTNGCSTKALFCLPTIAGDPARSDTGIVA
jgi:hypothetical protein